MFLWDWERKSTYHKGLECYLLFFEFNNTVIPYFLASVNKMSDIEQKEFTVHFMGCSIEGDYPFNVRIYLN